MENTTNQTTTTQEPINGASYKTIIVDEAATLPDDVALHVQTLIVNTPTSVSKDPRKLLDALYWVWDAFERTNMPYFLVHQTAKDVIADKDLTGDKVEVGVRRLEWISGGRRILDAFITPKEETETQAIYEFEGVPVIVHVYEDSDCIVNTDMKRYRYETFKVPNPYSEFERIYG